MTDYLRAQLLFNCFLRAQGDEIQYYGSMSVRPRKRIENKLRTQVFYSTHEENAGKKGENQTIGTDGLCLFPSMWCEMTVSLPLLQPSGDDEVFLYVVESQAHGAWVLEHEV